MGGHGRERTYSSREPPAIHADTLELWSFEASPYCRIVRETLCRLELPYLLHNVAYLSDPNTGVAMFESADIVAYLEKTYGAPGA
jgi:hypothetical protein